MPNNDNNTTKIPVEFKTFLEWKGIIIDAFSDFDKRAIAFVKPATGVLGVVLDNIEGKSWTQITGKLFGTVLDEWVVGKIGRVFKATNYVQKISKGVGEGFAVWTIGKTDYSAANYFEKAFPKAAKFYSKLINDNDYAHSVWNTIKSMADTDQIMNYYKNITFEQYMRDLKDLFDPDYQIPTGGVGVTFENKKATVIAPKNSEEEKTIVDDIIKRPEIKQIQLNNVTFNITQTNNLTVRNAIDDIPEVSLLLTHILIKPGEKLDLGDKGIYTVKSGDTLSQIANNIDYRGREAV